MKHQVIQDHLEEYLAGTLSGGMLSQVESHLSTCAPCRQDVEAMRGMSAMFLSLRNDEVVEASPNFYAHVSRQVAAVEEERASSIWAALFDPIFIRRVAFASLLVLASLGSYLVSQEADYRTGPTPEMVLALDSETPPPLDARDHMLVTLVSYNK
jgi:anti-sigma factor RsiW